MGRKSAVAMLELRLTPDSTAPVAARMALAELALEASERQAVVLLASELVTNCLRHAGLGPRQRIHLRAHVTDQMVHIEVVDSGTSVGVAMGQPDAAGGWGLVLVDRIADRWGVIGDAGSHVWFELDRTSPPPRAAKPAAENPGSASPRSATLN